MKFLVDVDFRSMLVVNVDFLVDVDLRVLWLCIVDFCRRCIPN